MGHEVFQKPIIWTEIKSDQNIDKYTRSMHTWCAIEVSLQYLEEASNGHIQFVNMDFYFHT